jgi:Apea-like HEPN
VNSSIPSNAVNPIRKKQRHPSGRVVVGTPTDFTAVLPFRLSPRAVLRAATGYEIKSIKDHLRRSTSSIDATELFECDFEVETWGDPNTEFCCTTQVATPRPRADWRYCIVHIGAYRGGMQSPAQEDLVLLHVSSEISTRRLFLNSALVSRYWESLDFAADWHHFSNPAELLYSPAVVSLEDLNDWKQNLALLAKVEAGFPAIWHSIVLFSQLPRRKGHNELTVLALFSVIESLLTHNPRGDFDSIGHQIRTKIVLAQNRMDMVPSYADFGSTKLDAVWKKLYELRSRIAHGSSVEFEGALQVLDDAFTVELFLFSVVRSLLRVAVREPQLIIDLKAV